MRLRSLRRLPLIAEAALCLLAVESILPLARLITISRLLRAARGVGAARLRSSAHARALLAAVATASRRVPGEHRCLAQALTAQWLLGRRGIGSSLALGVKPLVGASASAKAAADALAGHAGGDAAAHAGLVAHAWLTLRGRVIYGGPVAEFTPLPPIPLEVDARARRIGRRRPMPPPR